jgi:hypothetical protein
MATISRSIGAGEGELVDMTMTGWSRKTKKEITPGGVTRQHIANMENGRRPIGKESANAVGDCAQRRLPRVSGGIFANR